MFGHFSPLKQELFESVKSAFNNISLLKEASNCSNMINSTNLITKTNIDNIELGTGQINVRITLKEDLFYQVLTQMTGVTITNEADPFCHNNHPCIYQEKV